MRRRLSAFLAALSLVAAVSVALAPGAAAHPYCGQVWGSLSRSAGGFSAGEVVNVRAGRHACFDRLVLDVDAPLTGWSVRYVPGLSPTSTGLPVRGGAVLEVVARAPAIATDAWFFPDGRIVNTSTLRTFRDVVFVSNVGGATTLGLGVRARLPFRVFVLPGPGSGSRLVVDVGHRWCAPGHTC